MKTKIKTKTKMKTKMKTKTKMKNKMETKTKILVFIFKFYYGTCSHHIGESATFVNLVEHS